MKLSNRPSIIFFAVLSCALFITAGCKSPNPPAPTPRASQLQSSSAVLQPVLRSSRGQSSQSAPPGQFDFYLLNLSWSPEFCFSHRNSPECPAHPGFVVHGLWPQNTDGTYPQYCSNDPGPSNLEAYTDIMPTASLTSHEWSAHGTCSGLAPDAYFDIVRRAFRAIHIPTDFTTPGAQPRMLPPAAILQQFASANPSFPPGAFALSCGNNYLTGVEACLDKGLHPLACQAVRSCRANAVKITPR